MKPLNYDTLAALPLFMGMDGAMLSSFYDEARPAVTIVRQGAMIARRGEECRTLTIVMDGSITVLNNSAKVRNKVNVAQSTWQAVHNGMYRVVNGAEHGSIFAGMKKKFAGKTGTAQQNTLLK